MFLGVQVLVVLLPTLIADGYGKTVNFNPHRMWPKRFYIEGTLSLPYAELVEPFTAWYDGVNNVSRIDMYGGMTMTVQHEDQGTFGTHYMVAPMTNEEVLNQRTCFIVNGTKDAPVTAQSILPDITNFTYTGSATYKDFLVSVWQYKDVRGDKIGKYTIYLEESSQIPVYYEMDGYNTLTGSHFDEYKIDYGHVATNFSQNVFDAPMSGMKCGSFPGPGHAARIVVNPMKEFIHPVDDSHLDPMHQDFRKKFNKKDDGNDEETFKRKHIFKHNLRYINSMNRQGRTYKLKVNHLAEHTPAELRRLRGRRTTPRANRDGFGRKEFMQSFSYGDVPESVNWRLAGAVTPVKDQATCGSCWSFGSTGSIEGALFLKHGKLMRLSQQNLMDCSWGFGNNGCDGGEEFRSFQYILKHGLTSEDDYGRYLGVDGFCHADYVTKSINITGYVQVPSGDEFALQRAIFQSGPISVGIDAAHISFMFYSHGVYYEPKCGNTENSLDHAVLAVGYGTLGGKPYWLVKNSWSTHWGDDGYVLMSREDNNCGVATDASYVTMK